MPRKLIDPRLAQERQLAESRTAKIAFQACLSVHSAVDSRLRSFEVAYELRQHLTDPQRGRLENEIRPQLVAAIRESPGASVTIGPVTFTLDTLGRIKRSLSMT